MNRRLQTHLQIHTQCLATLLVQEEVVRQQHDLQVGDGTTRRVVRTPAQITTLLQQVFDRQVVQLRMKPRQRAHQNLVAHALLLLATVEAAARLPATPVALEEEALLAHLRVAGKPADTTVQERERRYLGLMHRERRPPRMPQ